MATDRSSWVRARQSSYNPVRVMGWRHAGRLEGECEQRGDQGSGPLTVWFYCPNALKREWDKDAAAKVPHSKLMKAHYEKSARLVEGDVVLLRRNAAAKNVGVAPKTLLFWTHEGCVWRKDNACLSTVKRRPGKVEYEYWILSELDAVNLARVTASRLPVSDETYDFAETAAMTGLPMKTLRNPKKRRELGLTVVPLKTGVDCERSKGKRGKGACLRIMNELAFTKQSVDQFERIETPAIPVDRLSVVQAAKELLIDRFRIKAVTARSLVNRFVNQEFLDARKEKIPTATGAKKGWIITRISIDVAKRVTSSARNLKEAIAALQASKDSGQLRREWERRQAAKLVAPTVSASKPLPPLDEPAKSFISSFTCNNRGEYKRKQNAAIMRGMRKHLARQKKPSECVEDVAAELRLEVDAVKTSYYRQLRKAQN